VHFENSKALLRAIIRQLGGYKPVSMRLWPSKNPQLAQRYLSNCCNQSSSAHLHIDEFLTILKWAKEAGYHDAINYVCAKAEYHSPAPINKEEKKAILRKQLKTIIAELDKLEESE
jgi:hypothetical protein